jgi:hypothetical protein
VLDQIIDLLRDGGTHRVTDMARALGTTPQMVEAMLETLARMGHLRQLGDSCGGACASCPVAGTCTAEASGRVWTLTEKGAAEDT